MPDDGLQAATVSTGEASKKGFDLSAWVDRNLTFVFNIPTVVFLAALVAFPVGIVIYTSFTDWQLITNQESKGVWFANYFQIYWISPCKKKETNRFKSTVGWVKQMVYNKKENHNSLINRFELLYESGNRQSIIDPRPLVAGVPVNILCIDGGGLRGE